MTHFITALQIRLVLQLSLLIPRHNIYATPI